MPVPPSAPIIVYNSGNMLPGHAESVVSQQPAAMVHDELVESPRDDDDDDEEYSESHEASESDNDGNEDDIE